MKNLNLITLPFLIIFIFSTVYSLYLYQNGKNTFQTFTSHSPIEVHLVSSGDPVAKTIVDTISQDRFANEILVRELFNNQSGLVYKEKRKVSNSEKLLSYVYYFDFFGDIESLNFFENNYKNFMWNKYKHLYELIVNDLQKKITEENKNFEYFFNEFKNNEIIKKGGYNITNCDVIFKQTNDKDNEDISSFEYECNFQLKKIYEMHQKYFDNLYQIFIIKNSLIEKKTVITHNPVYIVFSIIAILSLIILIFINFSKISRYFKKDLN